MRYISPSDFAPLLIKKVCTGKVGRRKRKMRSIYKRRNARIVPNRAQQLQMDQGKETKRDNV